MDTPSKFVPETAEAFKRAARDLQRAYPLSLQQSQELLARVYGYADLHELQQTLAKQLPPGPYRHEMDLESALTFRVQVASRFAKHLPPGCRMPRGYTTVDELCLLEDPATRRDAMAFNGLVERELDPSTRPVEADLTTEDYVQFDAVEADDWDRGRSKKEGDFLVNYMGKVVGEATHYLVEMLGRPTSGEERAELLDRLKGIANNHPRDPLCMARILDFVCSQSEEEMDESIAQEMWPAAQRARKLFDQVIPKDFRGNIDPYGEQNYLYLATLYWGAVCASTLGQEKKALAWARRCLRLNPNDSFGARFLVEELDGTSDSEL